MKAEAMFSARSVRVRGKLGNVFPNSYLEEQPCLVSIFISDRRHFGGD